MRVDLRGRNAGMAQHRLQRPKIGSARQQMRGKGMTQYVRTNLCRIDARFRGQFADDLEKADAADMHIALPRRLRRARREKEFRFLGHKCVPGTDSLTGAVGYRNQPLFRSLADQDNIGPITHNRCARQGNEFRCAQTGPVKQFDQRREAIVERRGPRF